MSLRFQRLLFIILSLAFLTTAIFLILYNSKKNLIFFYTPSELLSSNSKIHDTVRIGGYVKKNSIKKMSDNQYYFSITDNSESIDITYSGLLPDLFREEQGVVIEGEIIKKKIINASTVFAKHDENYMPASIKKELKKSEYWKKEYE